MVAVAPHISRTLSVPLLRNAAQAELKDALLSKLQVLDPDTLAELQKSFFEAAQGGAKMPMPAGFLPFGCQTPAQALAASLKAVSDTYHKPTPADSNENTNSQNKSQPQSQQHSRYASQAKGPGIFSNPSTEKVASALRQQQAQTLNFLANQLGGAYARGDMSQFLGPHMCFEDALADMLFKLADKDQRDLMEQLRQYERGDQGLNGLISKGVKGLAGAAGGAAGGLVGSLAGPAGSATGAAVGYDLGQRLAGDITGNYGETSKQVQFQKIQMSVQNMTQMIQMLSNVLHAFDSANRNTISNMRG